MKTIGCALVIAVAVCVTIGACGGKQKQDTTPSAGDDPQEQEQTTAQDQSANMIPPEKMDEVTQALKRKGMIVSHCLAEAMENKEVPRGAHGKITFEIVMDTSGKPSSVKVTRTDIQAPSVIDCATKHVQDIQVSALPKPYETSFTFAMEAN